jgi:Glucoamylase and related glycosyl hydrolases
MKHVQILEQLYREIDSVILSRQHPVTGLLPASTAVNNHGNYTDAWVRDNVYSVICVWGLAMAFRRQGETSKSDLLEQATIKLMRGLLQSMMRQANKVEAFKYSLDKIDALHAKYDTATGLPVVADDAWGHLQIDATSLYLLMLAQMTCSGLRIICTPDEVDFVQNLVYYVSTAYRTPDYGIWERGNKINNGRTEINASSVGMAKAALQALDSFNLFGENANKRAIIHVIPDAVSLARSTLASLLPRESLSKECDSALLSVIGFPAFAVGKETLATETRDTILTKLGGNYGCKRFLWDGHQTVLEESSRIYYEHSELANFEHIESEWPLFYTYLYINALFDGAHTTAKYYRQKLESLLVFRDGFGMLPELYYVPFENIAAEKKNPRSQKRVPNDNIPLVWAQSLYLTGLMLDEGLLRTDDLDPLKMRRRATKFINTQIALVVLAENDEVKQHLARHGVIAESLQDIKPMAVASARALTEVYAHIGENKSLGLTGRPRRRLQSLATSQTYEINNKVYLSLSSIQSEREDYRMYDAHLMRQVITEEIAHIYKHWLSSEVAVFTLLVDQHLAHIPNVDELFATVQELQLRSKYDYIGYASANLAYRASRVNHLSVPHLQVQALTTQSLQKAHDHEVKINSELLHAPAQKILNEFDVQSEIITYRRLMQFTDGKSLTDNIAKDGQLVLLKDFLKEVYRRAEKKNYWLVSRLCFGQLNYSLVELIDSLTLIAARNLSIIVGYQNFTEIKVDQSFANKSFFDSVQQIFTDPLERTLVLELLAAIGYLARIKPELFNGLRSIQLRNFIMLYAMDKGDADDVSMHEWLGLQSPCKLMHKLESILISRKRMFAQGVNHVAPYQIFHEHDILQRDMADAVDTDWLEWRIARGLITHFDDAFLRDIWHSLMFAPKLIFGDANSADFVLDCVIVRSSMTPGEASFAHLIDHLTHQLHPAYYKSAVVEALYAYTQFCINNPQVRFNQPLVFNEVLENAAKRFIAEHRDKQPIFGRDLDALMRQSPHVFNLYVTLIYADITQPY